MTEAGIEICALCADPIRPGDKAIYRDIPDKGVVRVHIMCLVKARLGRIGRHGRDR